MIFNLMKPVPVQTATMYSYNGTVLPALPEWDKETYPYVYIGYSPMYNGYYMCHMCTEPFRVDGTGSSSDYAGTEEGVYYTMISWRMFASSNEWKAYATSAEDPNTPLPMTGSGMHQILPNVWSNYDVYFASGGLYRSASEPVPIYE